MPVYGLEIGVVVLIIAGMPAADIQQGYQVGLGVKLVITVKDHFGNVDGAEFVLDLVYQLAVYVLRAIRPSKTQQKDLEKKPGRPCHKPFFDA